MTDLSILIPMHNEQDVLEKLFARLKPCIEQVTHNYEIICVNDGSKDNTLALLRDYHAKDSRIKIISLSRNFGKEAALTAAIEHCVGDAVIPIDADLQDPPELIGEMWAKWKEGFQVVLATRKSRPGDSWLKRVTALGFYDVMNRMSTVKIPRNTGDFRLMDRAVVEAVKHLHERTRFMKGIFAWVGYKTHTIYFDRENRAAGNTSWNYRRLWHFALDGIFSFTTMPLRVWTYMGAVISLFAFVYALWIIFTTMVHGVALPGYASLMVAVLFMGGIQLISLGVIGEYVGRIYRETKQRPIYLVGEKIGF
jgi:glycosyltransferase involved in cell wall biosynthesis